MDITTLPSTVPPADSVHPGDSNSLSISALHVTELPNRRHAARFHF
ncbi:MAG: hypothetical protein Q7U57_19390 [Methylovulum sp.]|nr:hypothetical protein [Methylovulum sp.]